MPPTRTTSTSRNCELTSLADAELSAGDRDLDLRETAFDEDGLWKPGLRILAQEAGITTDQARHLVLEQGEARRRRREQERMQQRLAALVELAWQHAGVPRLLERITYASLHDVARHDPAALQACRRWSAGPTERPGLLLRGSAGNGKTCLAVAALRGYVERTRGQRPVRFRSLGELLLDLQPHAHGGSGDAESPERAEGARSLWQMVAPYRALVIDELGRRKLTDWVQEQLHMLFDMCWREGKRLIVTTNVVDPDRFDAVLDPATQSRLYAMCEEVYLHGPDYRLTPPSHPASAPAPLSPHSGAR